MEECLDQDTLGGDSNTMLCELEDLKDTTGITNSGGTSQYFSVRFIQSIYFILHTRFSYFDTSAFHLLLLLDSHPQC